MNVIQNAKKVTQSDLHLEKIVWLPCGVGEALSEGGNRRASLSFNQEAS